MIDETARGSHQMVGLANGEWTCICNTIHASNLREDVHIHIEWALRQQLDNLWGHAQRVMNRHNTSDDEWEQIPASALRGLGDAMDACRPAVQVSNSSESTSDSSQKERETPNAID